MAHSFRLRDMNAAVSSGRLALTFERAVRRFWSR
jgi:hypothetical protein